MAAAHPDGHLQNPAKLQLSPAFLCHQKNWGLREKVREGQVGHGRCLGRGRRRKKGLDGGGKTTPEIFLGLWNVLQRVLPVVTAEWSLEGPEPHLCSQKNLLH